MIAARPSRDSYLPDPAKELRYTFGGRTSAVLDVEPGTILSTWTQDCFGDRVRSEEDLPSAVCDLTQVNPVTGPFFVLGAEPGGRGAGPGDTLAVHIADLTPARPIGLSATFPHFGALTGTHQTAMLHPALEERVWVHELDPDRRLVHFRAGAYETTLPMAPMLGTVGVAPAGGVELSTLTCGPHGGNMDVPAVAPGATLYLGVNVHGGMFSLGDGHARQGDGELSGVAVECAMRVRLVFGLIKGQYTEWPRIETDDRIMSVGCTRPLEDAYRIANRDLVNWVSELTDLGELDAYQLVAQAGSARPGNVVNPNYSMVAGFPKRHLVRSPYENVHNRLRDAASGAELP